MSAAPVLRFGQIGGPGGGPDWWVTVDGAYLGRIVRYGREWDCWFGQDLHSQHHRSRRAAAEAMLETWKVRPGR